MRLTPPRDLPAPGRRQTLCVAFRLEQSPVFLVNSRLGPSAAAPSRGRPFSRSYGSILPSSLTAVDPIASAFSASPPVSVSVRAAARSPAAFLGRPSAGFAHSLPPWRGARGGVLHFRRPARRGPGRPEPGPACRRRHRLASLPRAAGAGMSTRCPSAAPSGLALGPDLPWADEPSPGNLGLPAAGIPAQLSLLVPASSLPRAPPPLAGTASPRAGRSPTARHLVASPPLRRRA